jgi:hypothetical protein
VFLRDWSASVQPSGNAGLRYAEGLSKRYFCRLAYSHVVGVSNPRPQMTGRGNQSTNSGKAGAGAGGVTGSLERSHAPLMSERSLNRLILVLHLPYRSGAYWLLLAKADRLRPGPCHPVRTGRRAVGS